MRIKMSSLISLGITILLIIEYRMFNLFKIPSTLESVWSSNSHILLLAVALILLLLTYHIDKSIFKECSFTTRYLKVLLLSLLLIVSFSMVYYRGQHLINQFNVCTDFLLVICAYPCFVTIIRKGSIDNFLGILNLIIVAFCVLLIIQHVLLNINGIVFLEGVNRAALRNDTVRMSVGSMGSFFLLYNFDVWYKNKNRFVIKNIVFFIIELYCVVFISQTRMSMFACALGIVASIWVNNTTRNKIFKGLSIIILCTVILIVSGALEFLMETFSIESYSDNAARFGAYTYYSRAFLNNPIFAQGFITNLDYSIVKYGSMGIYYYVDVGIIGLLAQVGIFIIPIFIWPVIRWGKEIIKILNNREYRSKYGFLVVMFTYLIATTFTLIITDTARSFLYPFYFAIFEYFTFITKRKIGSQLSKTI